MTTETCEPSREVEIVKSDYQPSKAELEEDMRVDAHVRGSGSRAHRSRPHPLYRPTARC